MFYLVKSDNFYKDSNFLKAKIPRGENSVYFLKKLVAVLLCNGLPASSMGVYPRKHTKSIREPYRGVSVKIAEKTLPIMRPQPKGRSMDHMTNELPENRDQRKTRRSRIVKTIAAGAGVFAAGLLLTKVLTKSSGNHASS